MSTGRDPRVVTFSIVAFDPETEELGVAVQSKFLAVGAVISWAQAVVGAVSTLAMVDFSYSPRDLGSLASGRTARKPKTTIMEDCAGRVLHALPVRRIRVIVVTVSKVVQCIEGEFMYERLLTTFEKFYASVQVVRSCLARKC